MKKEIVLTQAEARVINVISEVVREALKQGCVVHYNQLKKYCIELGMKDPPNILTIPLPVLEKCLEVVKEEWGL